MAVVGTIKTDNNTEMTIEYPIKEGKVDCSGDGLTGLTFSEDDIILEIDCSINNLEELTIPSECKRLNCNNNKLSKLVIPYGCEVVHCNDNDIKVLDKPKSCVVFCNGNSIAKII